MLDAYFAELEEAVRDFPYTVSYSFQKKFYGASQGFVKGSVLLQDESVLEFVEVKDADRPGKLKYRYHYRDKDYRLIFRYDNAPHHKSLVSFPHHKHQSSEENVQESGEPGLFDILREIKVLIGGKFHVGLISRT